MRGAVVRLVRAFAEGRLDDYFGSFRPDATFIFHTTPQRLMSLNEYRSLWERWVVEDGFRVLSCQASDSSVQVLGDVAIVTHAVETRVSTNSGIETLNERETIVLTRSADGAWLGVHEHLSPAPRG